MKKLLLAIALLLTACDNRAESQTFKEKQQYWVHYYKDTRTNLCFAGRGLNGYSALLTQVPCSPEVEKLVEPWDKFYE